MSINTLADPSNKELKRQILVKQLVNKFNDSSQVIFDTLMKDLEVRYNCQDTFDVFEERAIKHLGFETFEKLADYHVEAIKAEIKNYRFRFP